MAVLERVVVDGLAQGAVPPGYTFTRSTAALYVDSDGLLKWSAHNLLTYSEDWSNAAWVKSGSTINANAATAPDGTTTADEFVETADSSAHQLGHAASVGARVYTYSCYVKKRATRHWVRLMVYDGGATFTAAYFDLDTGLTGTVDSPATASMESVGDGWYRCTMVLNGTFGNVYIHGAAADGGVDTYAGSTSEGFYLWGAQLNYGSTATAYLPTTSAARYDSPRRQWDATNRRWGYVGEGSRTNLCPYTNDVSNAAWTNFNAGAGAAPVVTGAYAAAPDGTTTATKVDLDAGGGTSSDRSLRRMAYASATIGVAYSGAIWLKAATGGDVGKTVRVHLENAGPSDVIYTLTSEWVRVLLNAGTTTATDTKVNLFVECRGSVSSQSASVLMWGGQIEAGPAASSDIPNPGSGTMSRGADLQARALTGPEGTALSTQGTMVVEFSYLGGDSTVLANNRRAISVDDGTGSERVYVYNNAGISGLVSDGGATQALPGVAGAAAVGVAQKCAVTWKLNDVQFSRNGSHGTRDTTATMPTVTTIAIGGSSNAGGELFGLVYAWTISDDHYPTDAALDALTMPTTTRNQGSLRLGLGLGL